ncbi:aldose 1-epimerase family protein [Nocardioides caricicola]|uniref:Aldose 1-epimerase family protein n=1 Tax=Nocardioides caricicola TaxID=634770 RepID=A0ABW0N8M5_9ACTN
MLSGEQFEIESGGYRAVVTESGGALRLLEHDGRRLLDGFGDDEIAPAGRGQLLMPWPNRIRDGAYTYGGRDLQLPLTEPALRNASHGLVRWAAWSVEEHAASSVSLTYRLMAQTGYPWTLDLRVVYDLSADGLTVTQSATNLASTPAPYASGAHPYLTVGDGPVDGWELTLPAATRSLVDDRLLPVGREDVEGTAYDFRIARPIRGIAFNDAFTDLERDSRGVATVHLSDPASGRAVVLWVDGAHRWLQVFSADGAGAAARRSLAVEPMTAQADAFRSGEDLVSLAPGEDFTAAWGIRAL